MYKSATLLLVWFRKLQQSQLARFTDWKTTGYTDLHFERKQVQVPSYICGVPTNSTPTNAVFMSFHSFFWNFCRIHDCMKRPQTSSAVYFTYLNVTCNITHCKSSWKYWIFYTVSLFLHKPHTSMFKFLVKLQKILFQISEALFSDKAKIWYVWYSHTVLYLNVT